MTGTLLLVLIVHALSAGPEASRSNASILSDTVPLHCRFTTAAESKWKGTCGRWLGEIPSFSLRRVDSVQSGKWRSGANPQAVWAGEMYTRGDGPIPNDPEPVELEVYVDHTGVLRTLEGWYAVRSVEESPETIEFTVVVAREVAPSDLDRKIVQRAAEVLSSLKAWNRNDDRQCPQSAHTWSIYCAMEHASQDMTGGIHHRRPAMEAVRTIVDQRASGRNYHHRLMEYNNDPRTTLADVQSLFAEALRQMAIQ